MSPGHGTSDAEERYRSLFYATTDGILIVDDAGQYVDVNQSLCRILKASREKLIGAHFSDFIPPERLREAVDAFADLKAGRPTPVTFPLRALDGSVVELEWISSKRYLPGLSFCVCRDMTSQRKAELAVRASESRFRRIFETAGVAIWEEDFSAVTRLLAGLRANGVTDLGRYIDQNPLFVGEALDLVIVRDVNRTSLRLCKAENKEQFVASLHRIFLPETRTVFRDQLLAIWHGNSHFQAETVVGTLAGEVRHVALTMELPDQDPLLSSVLLTLTDITSRVEAEARHRRAVEAGKVGLWEWDIRKDQITWSDQIYDFYGLQPGTFGGTVTECANLLHPHDRDRVSEALNKALAGESEYDTEFRPIRPDGQFRWLVTSGRVTFDEKGQPVWMHGTVIDRTAQKKAEEAHQALERPLMLLIEASGALLASPRSAEVLRTIVELAQRFVSADAHSVWRRGSEKNVWRLASSAGLSADYVQAGLANVVSAGPLSLNTMLVEDITREPLLTTRYEPLIREGVRSMLIIPLHMQGQPHGTVVFYWKTPHSFSEAEVRIASALGNLAASALGTADLYDRQISLRQQAEASERRAAFLAESGAVLASSLDYESTLASVARLAVPSFADWSSVDIVDEAGAVQRVAVAHSDPAKVRFAYEYTARYPPEEGDVPRHALRTGKSMLVEEIRDEDLLARSRDAEHLRLIRELGLRSFIVAPMVVNGRSLGIVTFVTAESGRRYTAADLQTAEELARRAASAIQHARLYRDVRHSEERYRSLTIATAAIVWTADRAGAFVAQQPSWQAYTGQAWEEHRGFGWLRAVHPEDRESVKDGLTRCLLEEKTFEVEARLWHADTGEYRYSVARPAPVRNEDGSVREWVGTVGDIHERRKAEQERSALLAREQQARKTAELLNRVGPILAVELDPGKLAQKITGLATELAGAELGAFVRSVPTEAGESLVYTVSSEAFREFAFPRNTASFGQAFRSDEIILSDDITRDPRFSGSTFEDLREGALPIRSYLAVPVVSRSGEAMGGLLFGHTEAGAFTAQAAELVGGIAAQAAIALDNARLFNESQDAQTALRRSNQDLRRANEDLNQFAWSASHDLQEPLRMVAIYSQLLKKKYEGQLDPEADQFLKFTIDGAQRMQALVSDILAYTRAANTTDEPISPADANGTLTKALSNLADAIGKSGAKVTHACLPTVAVQEIHLLQLLQNLIGNAVKYRSEEPPEIFISVAAEENRWRFSIRDNGIGIPPAYHEQIFGLFKRLHSASEYDGTGIGLAICQKIVERYQGRIWVESEPGRGSTFFFTLPAAENR